MGAAAETIHGLVDRIGRLDLSLPEWNLPVGEMGVNVWREYIEFRRALEQCKESANDEHRWILERIENVKELGQKVEEMTFPAFHLGGTNLAADEQERQRNIHAQVQKQFEAFKESFKQEFGCLAENLEKTAHDSADFKLVLFGRTQVGKSTIREALTRGNGATIGHGSSSTTTECHEYTWRNLHVWDTPGIDSRKDTDIDATGVGHEERAALEKLETADIAVFVCKTDSLEVKERATLNRIVASGRPYLILMNVVSDFTRYSLFKKRGMDKKISREAQRGFIDDLLAPFPGAEAHLIPVHARACFFSRAKGAPEVEEFFAKWKIGRQEVYALSNFGEFRSRLTSFICGAGEAARRQTIDRVFVEKTKGFFTPQEQATLHFVDELRRNHKELDKARTAVNRLRGQWTGRALEERIASEVRCELDVDALAEEYIDNHFDDREIMRRWGAQLDNLMSKVDQRVKQSFQNATGRVIENLNDALKFNAAAFDRMANVENNAFDKRKVIKQFGNWIGGGGAALLAIAFFWNPAGWVAAIGGALAGLGSALRLLAGFFKRRDSKIRDLKQQLRGNLNTVRTKFSKDVEKALSATLEQLDSDLRRFSSDNEELEWKLGDIVRLCRLGKEIANQAEERMLEHTRKQNTGDYA